MAPYEIASSAIPPRNDKTEILKQVQDDRIILRGLPRRAELQ